MCSPQESCKQVELYLHQSLYFSKVNRGDVHRQVKDAQKLEKTAFPTDMEPQSVSHIRKPESMVLLDKNEQ